jgi:transcriptional regulator of acetoin/glycerol metabolism
LARVTSRHGRSLRLSSDALRVLLDYSWPGNARELENALEYAVAVCRGQTIHPVDLPAEVREHVAVPPEAAMSAAARGAVAPADGTDDRDAVERALTSHHWNREKAAAELGVSRSTLWRKMREFNLTR